MKHAMPFDAHFENIVNFTGDYQDIIYACNCRHQIKTSGTGYEFSDKTPFPRRLHRQFSLYSSADVRNLKMLGPTLI